MFRECLPRTALRSLVPYYFSDIPRVWNHRLAQVSGCRGSTIEPNRAISWIDYYLDYIEKWSLRMDIKSSRAPSRKKFLSGTGF